VGARYAVEGLLRHQGLSATYHARTAPHREVAIKLFDPELRVHSEAARFIEQTVTLTNGLPDHLVLHVTDHGFDPEVGAPFTVTELSAVPSLVQLVQRGPLSATEASTLLTRITEGLHAAHAQGLFHLSLKPGNLFVGPAPGFETKVADFGASKLRRFLSSEVPAVDVPWIAPEQIDEEGGARSDQFSAALVIFFALTGRSYWRSCQGKIDMLAWKGEIRAPRTAASARAAELGIELGTDLDRIFERGLAFDPSARYRTMAEFAAAFETAIGALPPPPRVEPVLAVPEAAGAPMQEAAAATSVSSEPAGVPVRSSARSAIAIVAVTALAAIAGVVAFRSLRGAPADSVATTVAARGETTSLGAQPSAGEPVAPAVANDVPSEPAPPTAADLGRAALAEPPSAPPALTAVAAGADASTAKAELAQTQKSKDPAVLTVRCLPACEMVFVDNKKLESAGPVQVAPGVHLVAAGRTGYPARTETITLGPGERHTTLLNLIAQKPAPPATPAKPAKPCGKFLKRCD
jgi:hypothetical protein